MSLAEYQEAWNQLLFDEKIRKKWSQGKALFNGLTEVEKHSINSLPDDRINLVAPGTIRGRTIVFINSIPKNISGLIGMDICEKLAYTYSIHYPSLGLYPYQKGFVNWLKFIKITLLQNDVLVPHLEDILNYEIKLAELIFYRIPNPLEPTLGPKLNSSAGLFYAGPEFKNVLEKLFTTDYLKDIPEHPKHGYLVTRGPTGLNLEKLHWTIFEILSHCNGEISWNKIVSNLIEEEDSLASQKALLLEWEKYYIKAGILCPGIS